MFSYSTPSNQERNFISVMQFVVWIHCLAIIVVPVVKTDNSTEGSTPLEDSGNKLNSSGPSLHISADNPMKVISEEKITFSSQNTHISPSEIHSNHDRGSFAISAEMPSLCGLSKLCSHEYPPTQQFEQQVAAVIIAPEPAPTSGSLNINVNLFDNRNNEPSKTIIMNNNKSENFGEREKTPDLLHKNQTQGAEKHATIKEKPKKPKKLKKVKDAKPPATKTSQQTCFIWPNTYQPICLSTGGPLPPGAIPWHMPCVGCDIYPGGVPPGTMNPGPVHFPPGYPSPEGVALPNGSKSPVFTPPVHPPLPPGGTQQWPFPPGGSHPGATALQPCVLLPGGVPPALPVAGFNLAVPTPGGGRYRHPAVPNPAVVHPAGSPPGGMPLVVPPGPGGHSGAPVPCVMPGHYVAAPPSHTGSSPVLWPIGKG